MENVQHVIFAGIVVINMSLTRTIAIAGTLAKSADFNSVQDNSGKELQPKTVSVVGTSFRSIPTTGFVYWTAGTIYYDGSAFTLAAGNSGADWKNKIIVATLTGGAATLSAFNFTNRIQDETQVKIGHIESDGMIRLDYYFEEYKLYETEIGGTGTDGAYNPGGSAAIYGIKHYSSLNIGVGKTITCGDLTHRITHIKVNGDATIAGVLTAGGATSGGVGVVNNPGNPGETSNAMFQCVVSGGDGGNNTWKPGAGGASIGNGGNGQMTTLGGFASSAGLFDIESLINLNSYFCGSGGGAAGGGALAAGSSGGKGTAIILLDVEGDLTCSGTIAANGFSGVNGMHVNGGPGGGGGSGMLIIKVAGNANFSGATITTNGGKGGNALLDTFSRQGAGGGGGGYIMIVVGGKYTAPTTITANGGVGGDNSPNPAIKGNSGSVGVVRVLNYL